MANDTMYSLVLRVNIGACGTWGEWDRRIRDIGGFPTAQRMKGPVLYMEFDHYQDRKTTQDRLRDLIGHRNFLISGHGQYH